MAMTEAPMALSVSVLPGIPLVAAGMDLARLIASAAQQAGVVLGAQDVVVVAQKIVSKAEGRVVDLGCVEAGPLALELAALTGRLPALAQLILDEATEVMRATPAAIITRHRTGHVTANSGIDASNVEGGNVEGGNVEGGNVEGGSVAGGAGDMVLLWPRDPDASARAIRAGLPGKPAVVIADSLGRAWRQGTVGTAIGAAGLVHTDDRRGQVDMFGRTLQATIVAVADAIAAFAVLAIGEGAEGTPVAIVRGAGRWVTETDGTGAAAIMRPAEGDLFP